MSANFDQTLMSNKFVPIQAFIQLSPWLSVRPNFPLAIASPSKNCYLTERIHRPRKERLFDGEDRWKGFTSCNDCYLTEFMPTKLHERRCKTFRFLYLYFLETGFVMPNFIMNDGSLFFVMVCNAL